MNSEKNPLKPVSISEREQEVLKFWNENKIFEKTLFENKGNPSYTFYDGPPFATGTPHNGHLLQSYIKDSIPRFQTMKGKYVRRVWGWDTHGLPVENLIEKELGFKNKSDIENYGVEKFTKAASDSVLKFEGLWKEIIPRLGRWVDMDNRYITMSNTYTESCWWAFSELYKKDLAYEGYKVMHICPRCETPLAASEVALGYADLKDISVYVKFELVDEPGTYLLAWTTTPWTLPGNTAIAINEKILYAKVKFENEFLIVAKDTIQNLFKENFEVLEEFEGTKLIGKKYKPVFDYYVDADLKNKENIYKVWHADFVTAESGTGIAHEAPAFGEDDYNLAMQNSIPTIIHVGMDGKFLPIVTDFAGERVKWKGETQATDKKVCDFLKEKGLVFKTEIITHSYPLCWRCDTPLLNYATSSWFVAVTKMRDQLVEENQKVYWVPENVRDGRMGQWLEGARDWAVSRNRYWGAPIPVWKEKESGEVFVPESLKELQTRTKAKNNYLLIRHGETDYNAEQSNDNSYISGIVDAVLGKDSNLNENGKREATEAVQKLKEKNLDIDNLLIITSPFKRTSETAKVLASGLGAEENKIITDERLQEWQVGEKNNGKSWAQVYEENKHVNYLHDLIDGGKETKTDIQNRMNNLIDSLEKEYVGKTILLVTHKGPISCLLSRANGELYELGTGNLPNFYNVKNCEVVELNWKPLPTDETGAVNFHLPHIDNVEVFGNNGNKMIRVGGVFDCWFESGSMPYAQFHYPFENKELFQENFPAEFIAEAQDQTRGWFYTMLVLGVGLFGKSPFKSVITSGLVMAGDGKKMSKSLKNYTDPLELVEKYGSDSMRYYLLSTPVVKGENVKFTDLGIQQVYSKNISRLLNVVSFYKMYETEYVEADFTSEHVLDKYIFARLKEVKGQITKGFEDLFIDTAFRPVEKFIDDLSVWYLRRSRDRFKSENEDEKRIVLQATKYLLINIAKMLAPVLPFTAEMIWQEIKDDTMPISVHMATWGEVESLDEEELNIIEEMETLREMVSIIFDERIKASIKVRQPLARVTFGDEKFAKIISTPELVQEIKDETNIREVVFVKSDIRCVLDTTITEELQIEGAYRELVRMIQDKRKQEGLKVTDIVSIVLDEKVSELEKQVVVKMGEELKKECGLKDISYGSEFKIVK